MIASDARAWARGIAGMERRAGRAGIGRPADTKQASPTAIARE